MIVKWRRVRRQNHWLDALYNASAAGHFCGVRLVEEKKKVRRVTLAQLTAEAQRRGGNVGDR